MTDEQHEQLGQLLNQVKGKVILSGYDSPLYAKLYKGWRVDRRVQKLTALVTISIENRSRLDELVVARLMRHLCVKLCKNRLKNLNFKAGSCNYYDQNRNSDRCLFKSSTHQRSGIARM